MNIRRVVVVSDLHCGSIFGLLPEGFVDSSEKEVSQNPGQKYLWECFNHFCGRISALDPDVVVINGDTVEGQQYKQHGSELCLPLLSDQVEAAEECLRLLVSSAKNAVFYGVQGTEYHVGGAARDEEALYKALGFTRYKGLGTGKYCKEVLDLDIEGVRLNIAHHVGVSGGLYRGGAIDREGAFASLATHDKIHCIIRSHVHNFSKTEYRRRHNITTPCWQLQTRFMRHKSVHRMIPDIGGVVVTVEPDRLKEGEDPIRIDKIMYDLPPVAPTKPSLRKVRS